MGEQLEHAVYVDAWMELLPTPLSPGPLLSAFEQGFGALWRRSCLTLGEVTVSAIVQRVLHEASENYPLLGALKAEDGIGIQFGELRRGARPGHARQLRDGMQCTLVSFLTIVGNLTDGILTPALHGALASAQIEGFTNGTGSPAGQRSTRRHRNAGAEP